MSTNSRYVTADPNGHAPDVGYAQPAAAPPAGDHAGLDFLSVKRSASEFERAQRHTGVVRALKIILPIVGVLVIVGFAGVLLFRDVLGPSIDLGSVTLENGNLVMENPKLNGTDSKQRPYNLSADRAIQNSETPSRVKLDAIDAKLPMEDGDFANVTAGTGEYDSNAKTLVLGGDVLVVTDSGMEIRLKDADVNMGTGRLMTENAVQMKSKEAEISAESLLVENNGDLIVFDRKVRMTLYPDAIQNSQITGSVKQ